MLEIGAKDVMAMLDLIDDGGELAAHPAVKAPAEDRGNLVCGQPPQAEFAAALEQFMDRKVSPPGLTRGLRQSSIWAMA